MNGSLLEVRSGFGRRLTLGAMLVFGVLLAIAVVLTQRVVSRAALQRIDRQLHELAAGRSQALLGDFDNRVRDVRFLSATPPIQGIIRATAHGGFDAGDNTTLPQWKHRLARIFSAYVRAHPDVTQLRYIGVADDGRELVRVDRVHGRGVVVADDQLQAKGNRDYFREAVTRGAGEVYVSELNLNQEHGEVAVPHMPTLRVAVPVFAVDGGKPFGIVIVNLDMRNVLRAFMAGAPAGLQPYLLNGRGDFLAHPDATRTFGFDLGKPVRWEDEFTPVAAADPADASPDAMRDYRAGGNLWHVVMRRVPLDTRQPAHFLTVAIAASDQMVVNAVASNERLVVGALFGAALVVGLCLVLIASAVRNRDVALARQREVGAIVDSSLDAIVGKTLDGVVTSWNAAAERMFGYTSGEAVGRTIASLVIPDERVGEEAKILRDISAGRVVQTFETVRRRKDGSPIDVSVTVSPIRGPDGTIIGAAKIARDISQQKAVQRELVELNSTLEQKVEHRTRALEDSVALQRGVIDNAGYAVIATDAGGTITLFNPAAERLLGYDAEELVGSQTPALFHDADEIVARAAQLSAETGHRIEPGFEVFVARAREGEAEERHWTYVRKDGVRVPVLLKVSALCNFNGDITGFLGIAVDRSNEERQQRALREAKAQAEAANRAKGEFLANMSHEIRSPMNAVLGMVQLLQRTPLNERQADYVDKAGAAASALLDIINDILDYSKIEAGRLELDPRPFVLDQLLREVSVIVGTNVGDKDVEVLFRIDPAVPQRLVGDAPRLKQILLNLAGNAIKFTEHGEVVIRVQLAGERERGVDLDFSVRDTGIGISDEQQQRLFRAFTQADLGTSRRYGGTGLGLVISQRLVRLMGGDLHLKSQLGQGSTFSFTASLARGPDDAVDKPAVPATGPNSDALHNLRVLIVDDNPVAREILSELSASLGWTAEAVAGGQNAVARIRAGVRYDVIFVDWKMPDLDGWETARLLRREGASDPAPVIFMVTAHVHEMLAGRLSSDQDLVAACLVKPVTGSDLFDAVAAARLGGQPTTTPARAGPADAASAVDGVPRLSGLRILLVDDSEVNRQIARELLGLEGARVSEAASGQAALDALRDAREEFDVVLMDIQMPQMDGYTATARIRSDLGMTRLPIVAMTANAMASDRDACLAAGMNEHVGKPFHIDKLVQTLRRLCGLDDAPVGSDRVPPEPSASPSLPASPPGYAFDEALRRLGNNRALYAQQARAFALRQADVLEQVRAHIASRDRDSAARLLHTARGLAGTLGANNLARCLADAEAGIRGKVGVGELQPMLAHAGEALQDAVRVLAALADQIDAPRVADGATADHAPDPAKVGPLIEQLEVMLGQNNMRALDLLADLRSALEGTAVKVPAALDEAVNNLDFASAAVLLGQFRAEVEA